MLCTFSCADCVVKTTVSVFLSVAICRVLSSGGGGGEASPPNLELLPQTSLVSPPKYPVLLTSQVNLKC